jgi:serine/threonine protein kinase
MQDAIGKGQFGQVKRAIHKADNKPYAVKIIKKRKISPSELSMLRNEIEVLKICQHPNIVALQDVFEDIKHVYVVLEILEGGDMFDYLNKRDF